MIRLMRFHGLLSFRYCHKDDRARSSKSPQGFINIFLFARRDVAGHTRSYEYQLPISLEVEKKS